LKNLCDFMILQRNADGFAKAEFCGEFEEKENALIVARVIREDDNMMIIPWQECELDGNKWHISLNLPQGGLYRIEARQADGIFNQYENRYDWCKIIKNVFHVGVGDVFVMAGQSNMSGYGKDPAFDPPQLGVHLFNNNGEWVIATHPLGTTPISIYPNNDERSGTSPGLSFGRMMSNRLHIPVGLISAALGGSSLESWNPAEEDPYLFESMKAKIDEVGGFAGMIWSQGCNETNEEEAPTYFEKFKEALGLWRKEFGHFPVVSCQCNRHASKEEENGDVYWGLVREAQRQASIQLDDVYLVPMNDLTTCDGIHNASSSYVVVGERIANTMLHSVYGQSGSLAPSIKKITKLDKTTIVAEFFNEHYLRTMDDLAHGMNIEDEEGLMNCTKVTAYNSKLTITAEREIKGKAKFHAYWMREVPPFLVRDVYGMPMLSCYNVPIE